MREDDRDAALIVTICLVGGLLLTVGWLIVTKVLPFLAIAVAGALD